VRVAGENHPTVLRHVRRPTFDFVPAYLPRLPLQSLYPSDEHAAAELLCMYEDLSGNGLGVYKDYVAEIQRIVLEGKPLVMNVKEGLGATVCIVRGEGIRLEDQGVNDKRSVTKE
jgi:hypothetical protein